MTAGYTRNVYIDPLPYSIEASRLAYDWYSTNPNIARVSAYGTITAVNPGVVTIRAILRSNPAVVGELQITVFEDTTIEDRRVKLTTDLRETSPFYGTEVSSGKGARGGTTMHVNYTRLLCFDNSDPNQLSPSPSLQDYYWISTDSSVITVSSYGTITAKGIGEAEIIGIFKNNYNIIATIEIQVIPG